jgi:hypothetical protein
LKPCCKVLESEPLKYGYVVEEGEGEESRAAAEAAAATAAAAESFWLMVGIGMDNSRGYNVARRVLNHLSWVINT